MGRGIRNARLVVAVIVSTSLLWMPLARAGRAPAASDSAFAAFSARPIASLSTEELAWLRVQRQWRARASMQESNLHGISSFESEIAMRDTGSFARLASRPYAELSDSERAWLVGAGDEEAARRPVVRHSSAAAWLVLGLLVGGVLGVYAMANAIDHAFDHAFEGVTLF